VLGYRLTPIGDSIKPGTDLYWLENRQAPYVTFLTILFSYLHPDVNDIDGLQEDALYTAAVYEDRTDEALLARLWRDLYGDESPAR
jgi:hypothetical protein